MPAAKRQLMEIRMTETERGEVLDNLLGMRPTSASTA
jgi:hypothetical protein